MQADSRNAATAAMTGDNRGRAHARSSLHFGRVHRWVTHGLMPGVLNDACSMVLQCERRRYYTDVTGDNTAGCTGALLRVSYPAPGEVPKRS